MVRSLKVRGAHASRVLLLASRRQRFGGLGRDAQASTRDACAPRTIGIGFRILGWIVARSRVPEFPINISLLFRTVRSASIRWIFIIQITAVTKHRRKLCSG